MAAKRPMKVKALRSRPKPTSKVSPRKAARAKGAAVKGNERAHPAVAAPTRSAVASAPRPTRAGFARLENKAVVETKLEAARATARVERPVAPEPPVVKKPGTLPVPAATFFF